MAINIARRKFIAALGGTAFVLSFAARAQQPAMPVIGFLSAGSPKDFAPNVRAFHRGLAEAGYVDGENVAIEYRWAEEQYDRLPALAADLVRRQVSVIAAPGNTAAVLAAKAAAPTIPIVFAIGVDPVTAGLVTSLARPGGNLTGVNFLTNLLVQKQFELLHEAVPNATVFALLVNPTNPNVAESTARDAQEAARSLGLQLHVLNASTERDIDMAFASMVQLRAGALVLAADAFFTSRRDRLAALTAQNAIPAIYRSYEFAAAGGLMAYGVSLADATRLVGVYTGRILKGEKPADLAVQQSTKVELVINLKTAKALGITVPLPLLGRADEVIE
jgi:putative tryptophan/tyrosine transport system substrate-binding protein